MNLTCHLTCMIATLDRAYPGVAPTGWCNGRVNCSWEAYQVRSERLAVAQIGLRSQPHRPGAPGACGSVRRKPRVSVTDAGLSLPGWGLACSIGPRLLGRNCLAFGGAWLVLRHRRDWLIRGFGRHCLGLGDSVGLGGFGGLVPAVVTSAGASWVLSAVTPGSAPAVSGPNSSGAEGASSTAGTSVADAGSDAIASDSAGAVSAATGSAGTGSAVAGSARAGSATTASAATGSAGADSSVAGASAGAVANTLAATIAGSMPAAAWDSGSDSAAPPGRRRSLLPPRLPGTQRRAVPPGRRPVPRPRQRVPPRLRGLLLRPATPRRGLAPARVPVR